MNTRIVRQKWQNIGGRITSDKAIIAFHVWTIGILAAYLVVIMAIAIARNAAG